MWVGDKIVKSVCICVLSRAQLRVVGKPTARGPSYTNTPMADRPGIYRQATFLNRELEGTVTPVPRSVRRLPDDDPPTRFTHFIEVIDSLKTTRNYALLSVGCLGVEFVNKGDFCSLQNNGGIFLISR
jgi:hypothetical protein